MPHPNLCHHCTQTKRDLIILLIDLADSTKKWKPGTITHKEFTAQLKFLSGVIRRIK